MRPHQHRILILLVSILCSCAVAAQGADYVIKPGGKNKVNFLSKATMESFEGKTDKIEGTLSVADGALGDSITVTVTVDLTSLDTGIGKRNTHMRNNHLETDLYPTATFTGAAVLSPSDAVLSAGTSVTVEIEGVLDLHGVSKRTRATVDVLVTAEGLTIRARLMVSLADHNISRPKFLFLRLSDIQEVSVEALAVPAP